MRERKVRLSEITLNDVADVLLRYGFRMGLPRLIGEEDVTVTVMKADLGLLLLSTKARRTKATDEAWERCFALIDTENAAAARR